MPSTSIIIFDDDPDYVETIWEILENNEFHVIFSAPTIQDLESEIEANRDEVTRLVAEGHRVVALIGNIAPWKPGGESDYRGVGRIAENRIKAVFNDVTCIALTSTNKPGYGVDHIPSKDGEAIITYLSSLHGKET